LQTALENTKTDLAYIHKSKKILTGEKETAEKELEILNKDFAYKEEKAEDHMKILKDLNE
jgi:hypothetical protein